MSLQSEFAKIQNEEVGMEVKVVIKENGKPAREVKLEKHGESKNFQKFMKSPTEDDKLIATVYVPK